MEVNTKSEGSPESLDTHFVEKNSERKYYLFTKRTIDVVISVLALVFLSVIFVAVFVLDHCGKGNKGPLFYRQTRVGLHGKRFKMYKFRSMIVDADVKLKNDKKLYEKYLENNFKLEPKDDPRITKLGRVLRESSLDEIPQFINILKGDMTLVGPRPVVERELSEYNSKKLLSVRPGAMGLWQASGRSMIGYPRRARIEMYYIDHASLLFDLKIVFRNVANIFSRKGAY